MEIYDFLRGADRKRHVVAAVDVGHLPLSFCVAARARQPVAGVEEPMGGSAAGGAPARQRACGGASPDSRLRGGTEVTPAAAFDATHRLAVRASQIRAAVEIAMVAAA